MQFHQLKRRDFITLIGGAAVAWPLAARSQQPAMPVIGFMSSRSPEDSAHLLEAFRRGLREGGFIDRENVAIRVPLGPRRLQPPANARPAVRQI